MKEEPTQENWHTRGIAYSGLCSYCREIFYSPYRWAKICTKECLNNNHRDSKHHCWRGGRIINHHGYALVSAFGHPRYGKGKSKRYVLEHTLVMERMIGRYLRKGESVHHKNGIRTDNRPENLELWATPQPFGQRVEDLIDFVVSNYKEKVRAKIEVSDILSSLVKRFQESTP